jgi:hypothetical protein
LHHTASALIEARRFCARYALMVVHSFSQTREHFGDYATFAKLFDIEAAADRIHHAGGRCGTELYLGWVTGEAVYL